MAPETSTPVAGNTPAANPVTPATVKLAIPQAGMNQAVPSTAGGQLQFEFDPSKANFERVDNNLVIKAEGGGSITLSDYFVVGEEKLPDFVMADGTVIAATDFLAAQNPNMDITTAAGPASSSSTSGGMNSYDDNTGALISGTARLGSLATEQWDRTSEAPQVFRTTVAATGGGLTPVPDPDPTPTPPGPVPGVTAYNARAVMYYDDDAPQNSVAFGLFYEQQQGHPVLLTAQDLYSGNYTQSFDSTTLKGNFTQDPASRRFIYQADASEAGTVGYVTVTVNGPHGSFNYVMQVVIAADGTFDNPAVNANTADGWTLDPSYPNGATADIMYGEFHGGSKDQVYTVQTSTGNDELTFASLGNGSTIALGEGNDYIRVDGHIGDGTFIYGGNESFYELNPNWTPGSLEDRFTGNYTAGHNAASAGHDTFAFTTQTTWNDSAQVIVDFDALHWVIKNGETADFAGGEFAIFGGYESTAGHQNISMLDKALADFNQDAYNRVTELGVHFESGLNNLTFDGDSGGFNTYLQVDGNIANSTFAMGITPLPHQSADHAANVHVNGAFTNSSIEFGNGNDYIAIASNITGSTITGGLGLDTLSVTDFGTSGNFSLSNLLHGGNTIAGFEFIDLSHGVTHTMSIAGQDLVDMHMDTKLTVADFDHPNSTLESYLNGAHGMLTVTGDAAGSVAIDSSSLTATGTTASMHGVQYDVYTHTDSATDTYLLLVQHGIA